MSSSKQLILPDFETYLKCSNWLGRASIRRGLTAWRSLMGRAISIFRSRLPPDWRARRMPATYYTIPPGEPLRETFVNLARRHNALIFDIMNSKAFYGINSTPDSRIGNYLNDTYHVTFHWRNGELSEQQAYDAIKRHFNTRRV